MVKRTWKLHFCRGVVTNKRHTLLRALSSNSLDRLHSGGETAGIAFSKQPQSLYRTPDFRSPHNCVDARKTKSLLDEVFASFPTETDQHLELTASTRSSLLVLSTIVFLLSLAFALVGPLPLDPPTCGAGKVSLLELVNLFLPHAHEVSETFVGGNSRCFFSVRATLPSLPDLLVGNGEDKNPVLHTSFFKLCNSWPFSWSRVLAVVRAPSGAQVLLRSCMGEPEVFHSVVSASSVPSVTYRRQSNDNLRSVNERLLIAESLQM